MKQNGAHALIFLGLICVDPVGASHARNKRINPELEPTSHDKFFGKDYPDDVRAPEYKDHYSKFGGHPYPTIQDSDRYDKDYVKDENDDGGYWKAQMEYDRLKNKLVVEKKEMARALAKETEEQKEFEKAKIAEDAAEKAAEHAEAKEEDAANDRKKADALHDELKDHLDEATEEVETEVKDLEDCKKQLAEAKAKLKALLAEKEAAEKKEAEKHKDEQATEEVERAAEKTAAELWKEYQKLLAQYKASSSAIDKEKQDVKDAEAALKKQAKVLATWRRADPDGGVYEVKSNAASYAGPLAMLLLVGISSFI